MESPNRKYLPAVDHLRAFAALLVIIYHCCHLLYPRIALHRAWQPGEWIHTRSFLLASAIEGHTAVSLFLVVSGFILTYGSLGRQILYRDFFLNRFLRLFPLFFFLLITGANAFRPQFQLAAFLTSVLQFGNLGGGSSYGMWASVAWSVSVEAQLYLLFPAIRHFLNSDRIWPVLRLAVLTWLVRLAALALGADILDVTYWTALGRVDQFMAGAVLAWLVHRYGIPRRLGTLFPLIAAMICAILYGFHLSGGFPARQSWRIAWPTIEAIYWVAFVGCYLGFARWLPGFVDGVLRFLGRISYSLYFVHVIVIAVLAGKGWYFTLPFLTAWQNVFLTAVVLVLPMAVGISALTYAAIEAPFLSMRRRYNLAGSTPVRAHELQGNLP